MRYTFDLYRSRQDTPETSDYIFDNHVDPLDDDALYDHVQKVIPEDCDELILHATGLTIALLVVMKYCEYRKINLTVMHFNRDCDE